MKKALNRKAITISVEDGRAQITMLKPASARYRQLKEYIVLYEDTFGALIVEPYAKEDIIKKFNIEPELLKDI